MDRNAWCAAMLKVSTRSLSARRAWIEIGWTLNINGPMEVALRKESVDRNSVAFVFGFGAKRRSPQGERG